MYFLKGFSSLAALYFNSTTLREIILRTLHLSIIRVRPTTYLTDLNNFIKIGSTARDESTKQNMNLLQHQHAHSIQNSKTMQYIVYFFEDPPGLRNTVML